MEEKLTDNIEENEENEEEIPTRERWKRFDVDTIKRKFSGWIDDNIENEYKSYPEFFIKDEEKRFYIHIQEKGYTDEDPEDEGYYCIVEPFEAKRVEDL